MSTYSDKIFAFYKAHKRMPVYAEIMQLLGFKSKNAVYKLVHKLIDEGILTKDHSGRLIPNRIIGEIPLLGLVEAGIPTTAEENILDTLNIEDYLVKEKDSTYMLRVKGDSMIEAGIHEGDLVIAVRRNDAKDGDIVIAEVDGGWTMKYFRKDGNIVFLEPANSKYAPIYPEYDIKIGAVVKGIIRKY
jgi:SOS regulatory protein LexA